MGHLHDNVSLLLIPEFISFFPSYLKGSTSEVKYQKPQFTPKKQYPEGFRS